MSPVPYILVVDDDMPIAEFVVEVLTEEGYTVRSAFDGEQAIQQITADPPALVLLDIRMPTISGIDVLTYLRESGFANLPIVVMTADARAVEELQQQHIAACLIKPFEIDDLLGCVARHLKNPSPDNSLTYEHFSDATGE